MDKSNMFLTLREWLIRVFAFRTYAVFANAAPAKSLSVSTAGKKSLSVYPGWESALSVKDNFLNVKSRFIQLIASGTYRLFVIWPVGPPGELVIGTVRVIPLIYLASVIG
ncbi:hypothetical protein [Alteribacter keqinensis]|uniref:Uncharacterized protein n=1 Tax=Alteribacter keqinensis TaxID=2483800 RepID=A0A3M7TP66_9BACI|nr:hypothetical protein [Alteribacter keqinensis]RNA66031.1 hypothetical protein EBO34_19965 [Alteribacter keqinensis]